MALILRASADFRARRLLPTATKIECGVTQTGTAEMSVLESCRGADKLWARRVFLFFLIFGQAAGQLTNVYTTSILVAIWHFHNVLVAVIQDLPQTVNDC